MRKLKRVQQLDQHGCTIACIAMIVDMSYFMVREMIQFKVARLEKQPPVPPQLIGLYCEEISDVLGRIYKVPCKFVKFSSLRRMKKHCILWVTPLMWKECGTHVILFDADKRCILDPMNMLKKLDKYNVACCMEID